VGEKTRLNHRINLCLKEDCINRDKKCEKCIRYSCYVPKEFRKEFINGKENK